MRNTENTPAGENENPLDRPRILVVEDESILRLDLSESLNKMGYRVVAATGSGEEAIGLAGDRHSDLVLMDIALKGALDGIETADRIRGQQKIPVVFLTAFDNEDRLERAKLSMPVGYLLKPVNERELKATIEIALYTARIYRERDQAHEALRESERLLRQEKEKAQRYLDIAAMVVLVLDENGRVSLINRTGCDLLGWPEAEIVGRDWFDGFIPDEERGVCQTVFQELLSGAGDRHRYMEKHVMRRDGGKRLIAWHNTLLLDEAGEVRGTLSSGLDITERNLLEQELAEHRHHLEELVTERTAELERLAHNLQLEIAERRRTESALKTALEEQRILLQEVHHRVKNNLAMIISMLNEESEQLEMADTDYGRALLSRLTGRVQALFTAHQLMSDGGWRGVALSRLCERVVSAAVQPASTDRVKIEIAPSPIQVDARQAHNLTLVVNELTTNSLKHARLPKTELLIQIDLAGDAEEVTLCYRDNGLGYPPEMLTDGSTLRKTGLELIEGIIGHSMQGRMKLRNERGALTEIVFMSKS